MRARVTVARPNRRRAVLGINLGASSVGVVAVDLMGLVISQAAAEYPIVSLRPGWAETGPHAWLSATAAAVRRCLADAGSPVEPVAVGISGVHGVVAADATGRPVRPAILWLDTRAARSVIPHPVLREIARPGLADPVMAGMAAPTLGWLAQNEPGNWARTRWALQPKDWVRAQLTGQFCTEPSDASKTRLYDPDTGQWTADVLTALGVRPEVLPVVLAHSGDRAGCVTRHAAGLFGLPMGIPVAAGAADIAATALGAGMVKPGQARLEIGVGAHIVTPLDSPRSGSSSPSAHIYRAATDHGWYAWGAVPSAGRTLDWVQQVLGASRADLHASAGMPPKFDDPIFLPHLDGERTPRLDADVAGSWSGLRSHHVKHDLLRSAWEGVAFAIRDAAEDTLPPGDRPEHLWLSGSCSAGEDWRQMLADILGYPLHVPDAAEVPGIGAALLGARAAGLADEPGVLGWVADAGHLAARPDARFQALYRHRYEMFTETILTLKSLSAHEEQPCPQH